MSGSSSGLRLECAHSRSFHAEGIPLLVSPELLRRRELGQIDLARIRKKESWIVEVAEVKSSAIGAEALVRGQRRRLIAAGNFLSGIFGASLRFISLVGKK